MKKRIVRYMVAMVFFGVSFGGFGQEKTTYSLIQVGNLYGIEVPDYMYENLELNDDASLQYSNNGQEKYVIVIDESKEEFIEVFRELGIYDDEKSLIDNYADYQYKTMVEGIELLTESKNLSTEINGMPARLSKFDAKVDGVPEAVSYFFGYIEGEQSLYMIMTWTLASMKSNYSDEAKHQIMSFKELGGSREDWEMEDPVDLVDLNEIMEIPSANKETLRLEVNAQYAMNVPAYMERSFELNAEASLQYNNLIKEKYVIVIDENKQEFIDVFKELGLYDASKSVIDNYADQQFESLSNGVQVLLKGKIQSMKIHGMEGRTRSLDANVDGISEAVSYFFGFVEGKESLYMIMAWTLSEGKKSLSTESKSMFSSFEEL